MLLSLGASIGAFHQRECRDCERLRRFGGFTTMKPPRGLSISAMSEPANPKVTRRVKSCILISPDPDCFIRYHNSCASRQQCLGKPFRGQVSAQSFFAGPIEDEARHCGELPAELVITRFVGKQGLLARSSPFDPLAEKFAGLDRARRRRAGPWHPGCPADRVRRDNNFESTARPG